MLFFSRKKAEKSAKNHFLCYTVIENFLIKKATSSAAF